MLLLVPGKCNGPGGYLRIGYANTPEVIAAGLDKMESILRSCRCKLCAAGIAGCFFRFVVSIYKIYNIQA